MDSLIHLIQGCIANNAKCQKNFYEKYLGFVLKTAYRYVSSYDAAAEIANDAFVKIFRTFEKFDYAHAANIDALLMGWMRRIVINTSIDHLRMLQSQKKIHFIGDEVWGENEPVAIVQDQLVYKEIIELVRKLSPAYRTVFNMYVIDGYSHQEIADVLRISVGTSKSNLARAKAFLQKYLVKDSKGNVLCFS